MKRWIILGLLWATGIAGCLVWVGVQSQVHRAATDRLAGELTDRNRYEATYQAVKGSELPRLMAGDQVNGVGSTSGTNYRTASGRVITGNSELDLWLAEETHKDELRAMTLQKTNLVVEPQPIDHVNLVQKAVDDAWSAAKRLATFGVVLSTVLSGVIGLLMRGQDANLRLLGKVGVPLGVGLVALSAAFAFYVWSSNSDRLAMYDLLKAGRGSGGTIAELVAAKSAVNRALVLGLVGAACGGALIWGSKRMKQPAAPAATEAGELA